MINFSNRNQILNSALTFILSLGETRSRDYGTLFNAVQDLPIELFVATSGHWYAREKERDTAHPVPNNVNLSGTISSDTLRILYAQSQFVVLPVYDSVFSAGSTASLGNRSRAENQRNI